MAHFSQPVTPPDVSCHCSGPLPGRPVPVRDWAATAHVLGHATLPAGAGSIRTRPPKVVKLPTHEEVEVLRFAAPGTPDGDEHPRLVDFVVVLTPGASSFRASGQGAGICLTWHWTVSDDARGVQ